MTRAVSPVQAGLLAPGQQTSPRLLFSVAEKMADPWRSGGGSTGYSGGAATVFHRLPFSAPLRNHLVVNIYHKTPAFASRAILKCSMVGWRGNIPRPPLRGSAPRPARGGPTRPCPGPTRARGSAPWTPRGVQPPPQLACGSDKRRRAGLSTHVGRERFLVGRGGAVGPGRPETARQTSDCGSDAGASGVQGSALVVRGGRGRDSIFRDRGCRGGLGKAGVC
jgi:hypothetical protein